MNLDKYEFVANDDHKSYEFDSEGPKGLIKKAVIYKRLAQWNENVFNLEFGDWDERTQNIDYNVKSNNNDRDKILATVAATVLDFTALNPTAIVYAVGATPSRTRLYQMGINTYWDEISKEFAIYGFRQGYWEPFQQGRNYEAFVGTVRKLL
jgi:hypothetical protein